jgi:hypothetical protein
MVRLCFNLSCGWFLINIIPLISYSIIIEFKMKKATVQNLLFALDFMTINTEARKVKFEQM